MKLPFFRINAFIHNDNSYNTTTTNESSTTDLDLQSVRSGNPAAVVILTESQNKLLSDDVRQSIATELNLSETSYVVRTSQPSHFKLRWFTPVAEVALCGHATLAAASAVFTTSSSSLSKISFETMSGTLLTVTRENEGQKMLSMKFPAILKHENINDKKALDSLKSALGIDEDVKEVFKTEFDLVMHMKSEEAVKNMIPDFKALKKQCVDMDLRGVLVCAGNNTHLKEAGTNNNNNNNKDFVSRFFAPRLGINEDPVTGSAHCVLAPLFLNVGEKAEAKQLSARGGRLTVEREDEDTVIMKGRTKIVIEGTIKF